MALLDQAKAIRTLRMTPVILRALLHGVDDARARAATDGPDGWSVIEVIGHMADYDQIFLERTELMLTQDQPTLPLYDHEALVLEHDYKGKSLEEAVTWYETARHAYLTRFRALDEAQLTRVGLHPQSGPQTVLETAINAGLHDVNHLDQIARALGLAERFAE